MNVTTSFFFFFLHVAQPSGSHLCRKMNAIAQDMQMQMATWNESPSDFKGPVVPSLKSPSDSKPESKILGRACSCAYVIMQGPEHHVNSQTINSQGLLREQAVYSSAEAAYNPSHLPIEVVTAAVAVAKTRIKEHLTNP